MNTPLQTVPTSSYVTPFQHLLLAARLDADTRRYHQKLRWNRALDAFVQGQLMHDTLLALRANYDAMLEAEGHAPKDYWRAGTRFIETGVVFTAVQHYGPAPGSPEMLLSFSLEVDYRGEFVAAVHVRTSAAPERTRLLFRAAAKDLPSFAGRPWAVARKFKTALKGVTADPDYATNQARVCHDVRRSLVVD